MFSGSKDRDREFEYKCACFLPFTLSRPQKKHCWIPEGNSKLVRMSIWLKVMARCYFAKSVFSFFIKVLTGI